MGRRSGKQSALDRAYEDFKRQDRLARLNSVVPDPFEPFRNQQSMGYSDEARRWAEAKLMAQQQIPNYDVNNWPTVSGGNAYPQFTEQVVRGYSGNPSDNLQELNEVRAELKKRHNMKQAQEQLGYSVSPSGERFVSITDDPGQVNRLFNPLLPVNRYVHPDEHIEWLKGRTRSVCRKMAWAKSN